MSESSAADAPAARVVRRALACGFAAALVGFAFSPAIGLAVLGGAAVSIGNLLVLRRMVDGFRDALSARSALVAAGLGGVRYLLLGGALFAIIAVWKADWLGVVCGLAAPLLAVVLELGNSANGIFPGRSPAPSSRAETAPAPSPTRPPPRA